MSLLSWIRRLISKIHYLFAGTVPYNDFRLNVKGLDEIQEDGTTMVQFRADDGA